MSAVASTYANDAGEPKNAFLAWLESKPMPAHLRSCQEAIEQAIADERGAWD